MYAAEQRLELWYSAMLGHSRCFLLAAPKDQRSSAGQVCNRGSHKLRNRF